MRGRRALALAVLLGTTYAASLQVKAQNDTPSSPNSSSQSGDASAPAQTPSQPAEASQAQPAHGLDANEHGFITPFPAQQRPKAPPEVLARGKVMFTTMCGACHGADARGGQLGGVNLLRSKLVLGDRDGELVMPVVKQGRPGTAMAPVPLPDADIKAIVSFIHSLQAEGSNQGGPPPGPPVELNILVGNATAGEQYFGRMCATCHSPSGDLAGIASRLPDAKTLQNAWVSGGRATGGGEGRPEPVVTVKVTLPNEVIEGPVVRLDDFLVTVALPDGTTRTIRRNGTSPHVEVHDPLERHDELLGLMTDDNMHDVTAYLATLK
jgi:cytochrome c oxidase cbb3-type subunit 3